MEKNFASLRVLFAANPESVNLTDLRRMKLFAENGLKELNDESGLSVVPKRLLKNLSRCLPTIRLSCPMMSCIYSSICLRTRLLSLAILTMMTFIRFTSTGSIRWRMSFLKKLKPNLKSAANNRASNLFSGANFSHLFLF